MRVIIQKNYESVSAWAAAYVAKCINNFKPTAKKPFVLGLPAGTTPIGMYKQLIHLNKTKKVSFANVVTFNMDEYANLPRTNQYSFYSFMWNEFFKHINIRESNVNILNGMTKNLQAECDRYERKIRSYGGIELFIGGIGPDGHIAFNEPCSSLASRTRIKTLTEDTIIDNARFFGGNVKAVPKMAMTVGIATIMDARKVLVIVSGHNKARALHHAVENSVNHMWTISCLQLHPRGIIVCDNASTTELKVGTVNYFREIEKENLDYKKLLEK